MLSGAEKTSKGDDKEKDSASYEPTDDGET